MFVRSDTEITNFVLIICLPVAVSQLHFYDYMWVRPWHELAQSSDPRGYVVRSYMLLVGTPKANGSEVKIQTN